MKTADPPEALIALSGQIHLSSLHELPLANHRPQPWVIASRVSCARLPFGSMGSHYHWNLMPTQSGADIEVIA